MIADDFQIIRDDLRSGLEEEGFEIVSSVSSGREAVEMYEPGTIVLMDIEMESADAGIKATETILEKDKDARVIFLTSHDDDDVIMTAMATGAKDFVVKGSDIKDIATHIRDVEKGKPQLPKAGEVGEASLGKNVGSADDVKGTDSVGTNIKKVSEGISAIGDAINFVSELISSFAFGGALVAAGRESRPSVFSERSDENARRSSSRKNLRSNFFREK